MKWYKNPMLVFGIGLAVFAAGALFYNPRLSVFILLASVLAGSGVAYAFLKYIQPKGGHLFINTVVSTLIAFLLLNPALSLSFENVAWAFLGGAAVILAKVGPQFKRQVIFNPAALGLLGLSLLMTLVYGNDALLPTFVSWWGTDFGGYLALIILLPLISYAAYKFRKIYLVTAFLAFNAVWLYFYGGVEALVYPYITGTLYFLAGVMLLEPKTSPTKKIGQIVAALVAVMAYRYAYVIGFNNVELWAIIAVNVVNLLSKLRLSKIFKNLNSKHVSN